MTKIWIMTWFIFFMDFNTAEEDLFFNICLYTEEQLQYFMNCIHDRASKKVVEVWASHKANFGGLEEWELITMLCKAAVDAGDALYEEFAELLPADEKPGLENTKTQCSLETRRKYYGY
ncbi:uncharacterized protein LOC142582613 [Dermacentor variabilis]|uniref:uncharacterized protein LOC142582613 n=1 Tax=Dermacentor variabilis TaxID=34621 RepID=UPI003F5B14F4